jgi:hypothetical protein
MEPTAMSAYSVDSGIQYATNSGNTVNSYFYSPPPAVGVLGAFVPTNGQNSAQYPANNGFPVKIISVTEPADPPTMPSNPGPPLTDTTSAYSFGYAANNGVQYAADKSYYVPITAAPAPPAPTSGSTPSLIPGGPVRFNMTSVDVDGGVVNVPQGVVSIAARGVEAGVDNFYYQPSADQVIPTPPSGAPPVPRQLGAKTDTSIPVQFDTAGIAGTQPITYGIYISTTNPPTGPLIAASVLSGTNFYAVPTGLVASTQYFISSVADNGVGDPLVSTPLTITTTPTPTNPAPAPGIPYVSPTIPPTASTITIEFDTAGVVGTPSVTFASVLNPGIVPGPATLVAGTIYRSTYTGLSPSTNYVFQSSAVGTSPTGIIYSGLSAPIQTSAPAPGPTGTLTAPVQYSLVDNTQKLAVRFDVSGVVGATSYGIYISPNTTIQTDILYPAQLVSGTTYQGLVTGLINATPYYFWAVAINALGSLIGPISLAITTDATTGTAPSGPPGVPTLLSSTPTSLTFQTDAAGVTGTPTPQFLLNLGIDSSPAFVSQQAVFSSGTLWDTTFTGLVSRPYRCSAIAFNGISPNQASSVSSAYTPS